MNTTSLKTSMASASTRSGKRYAACKMWRKVLLIQLTQRLEMKYDSASVSATVLLTLPDIVLQFGTAAPDLREGDAALGGGVGNAYLRSRNNTGYKRQLLKSSV
ncbi:hypothetical protein [Pantoea sp. y20]